MSRIVFVYDFHAFFCVFVDIVYRCKLRYTCFTMSYIFLCPTHSVHSHSVHSHSVGHGRDFSPLPWYFLVFVSHKREFELEPRKILFSLRVAVFALLKYTFTLYVRTDVRIRKTFDAACCFMLKPCIL